MEFGRTALGFRGRYRSRGGATRIHGEGCVESVEYLLDLLLVPLNLTLVTFDAWCIHPSP